MAEANKPKADTWRQALRIISRCPVCSAPYNAEDARVFARVEAATMVHIVCGACQSFFMAMVVLLGAGVSSVGMVTDLSFGDIERLHCADPIDTDEMIEGHLVIQNIDFHKQLDKQLV